MTRGEVARDSEDHEDIHGGRARRAVRPTPPAARADHPMLVSGLSGYAHVLTYGSARSRFGHDASG